MSFLILLYYLYILPVCITCMYYLYVLPVCSTCMYYLYVLPVCITCMYYLYVLPVCTVCMTELVLTVRCIITSQCVQASVRTNLTSHSSETVQHDYQQLNASSYTSLGNNQIKRRNDCKCANCNLRYRCNQNLKKENKNIIFRIH